MGDAGLASVNEQVKASSGFVKSIQNEVGKVVIGQHKLVERLIIGLLSNGHVLLEGVPGLAKTLSVKTHDIGDGSQKNSG